MSTLVPVCVCVCVCARARACLCLCFHLSLTLSTPHTHEEVVHPLHAVVMHPTLGGLYILAGCTSSVCCSIRKGQRCISLETRTNGHTVQWVHSMFSYPQSHTIRQTTSPLISLKDLRPTPLGSPKKWQQEPENEVTH